jgi:ABC-type branched-subunit amino acid transport system ATPase component
VNERADDLRETGASRASSEQDPPGAVREGHAAAHNGATAAGGAAPESDAAALNRAAAAGGAAPESDAAALNRATSAGGALESDAAGAADAATEAAARARSVQPKPRGGAAAETGTSATTHPTTGATATPAAAGPTSTTADDGRTPVVEIRGVSKRFGSTQALEDVSLALFSGEIHALLGENGAGKSTVIRIMTGVEQPDVGEIRVDGKPVQVRNALAGQELGIAAIYQEPMIFPDLPVAENIFVSQRDRGRVVDRGAMRRDAEAILARLGVRLDLDQPARGLTLAEQQTLEIAKALSLRVRVLIMDEPTASLSAHEVRRLFRIVQALRAEEVAILFISHRMEEVFEIADRVTILRSE